jgi:hypothetical protein
MCHLCRKIEKLRDIDIKAAKPIYIVLSKLHKKVEPDLGDIWLWRLNQTKKLRTLLEGLHNKVPISPLKSILEDVDEKVDHIKRNMPDHPPRRSTGRLSKLKKTIAADSSASNVYSEEEMLVTESDQEEDSPGSDFDPPQARIEQSIRIVEEWLGECDAAMSGYDADDYQSIVSVLGGGVVERPRIDVGVWKKLRRASLRRSKSGRSTKIGTSSTYKHPRIQFGDCVYDKPSQKLGLYRRVVEKAVDIAAEARRSNQDQTNLSALFQRKKAQKLSRISKISTSEAYHMLENKKRREETKHMMSGGRSVGSPRTSLESLANECQSQTSYESSTKDSVSLTGSDIEKCLDAIEKNKQSDMTSSWSSRPSAINLGSLIKENRSANPERQPESPANKGNTSMTNVSSPSNQPPTWPIPVGRPPSPVPVPSKLSSVPSVICDPIPVTTSWRADEKKVDLGPSKELRRVTGRPTLKQESYKKDEASEDDPQSGENKQYTTPQAARMARTELLRDNRTVHPGEGPLSEAVLKSRRRRLERSQKSNIPLHERYRHDERERFWATEKAGR